VVIEEVVIRRIVRTLKAFCRHSLSSLGKCLRRKRKAGAHCCAPASFQLSAYGLELTVEWGTGIGP
jgi:hypothetical protein